MKITKSSRTSLVKSLSFNRRTLLWSISPLSPERECTGKKMGFPFKFKSNINVMVSTTLEKSIFIIFSLLLFSIAGLPLYNMIRDFFEKERVSIEFDKMVGTIASGIQFIETNHSAIVNINSNLHETTVFSLGNDSHELFILLENAGLIINDTVRSDSFTFMVFQNHFSGKVMIELKLVSGFINIRIEKVESYYINQNGFEKKGWTVELPVNS